MLIEMKYADNALTGKSGVSCHVHQFADFFKDSTRPKALADEMTGLAKQKRELGLLEGCSYDLEIDVDECQVGLLFANHDPDSEILLRELEALDDNLLAQIPNGLKFFCPVGGGYGLFHDQVHDMEAFRQHLAGRSGISDYRNRRFRSTDSK